MDNSLFYYPWYNSAVGIFIRKLRAPSFVISIRKVHVFATLSAAGFLWTRNLYLLLRPVKTASRVFPYTSFVLYRFLRALQQNRAQSRLLYLLIVNFRNWTMGVWENKNAKVQALFHARCLHSSFEFSQTFMNVSLLGENKERKLVLSFVKLEILEIFSFFIAFSQQLFQTAFVIVFSWLVLFLTRSSCREISVKLL